MRFLFYWKTIYLRCGIFQLADPSVVLHVAELYAALFCYCQQDVGGSGRWDCLRPEKGVSKLKLYLENNFYNIRCAEDISVYNMQ